MYYMVDNLSKRQLLHILDLLVREVNYAWWSEGCPFDLTEAEVGEVKDFMSVYNYDDHLNLIVDYEYDGKFFEKDPDNTGTKAACVKGRHSDIG